MVKKSRSPSVAVSEDAVQPNSEAAHDLISSHDQIQIGLAIAEENILKSLLTHCMPAIASPSAIGNIRSSIGVPIQPYKAIDGIIHFETIHCQLAEDPVETNPQLAGPHLGNLPRLGDTNLVRCESETYTLGQFLSLAQAIALLTQADFSPEQIDIILNLPQEACYKSWWYTLDADGQFTTPFLRLMRTIRYTDGTFTLQYKDYFAQDKPSCFKSQENQVLVEIKTKPDSFRRTLEKINHFRASCGINHAILICDTLSDLEAKGFMSQGISIYTKHAMQVPKPANCTLCDNPNCPMQGKVDSPVLLCRQFCQGEACQFEDYTAHG
jgi:hypothetical protein